MILLILGMHRSGTSLTANYLHHCGLHVGGKLVKATDFNAGGHFEDRAFHKLHINALKARGKDPDGLLDAQAHSFQPEEKARLQDLFAKRNAEHSDWGWKEPRTVLFVKDYAQLLPEAKYLVIFRDYRDVVDSLVNREYRLLRDAYEGTPAYRPFARRKLRKQYERFLEYMPNQYLRAWITYNRILIEHTRAHESSTLTLQLSALLDEGQHLVERLRGWGFQLESKDPKAIFRPKLMNKREEELDYGLDAGLEVEAEKVMRELIATSPVTR